MLEPGVKRFLVPLGVLEAALKGQGMDPGRRLPADAEVLRAESLPGRSSVAVFARTASRSGVPVVREAGECHE